MFRAVDFKKRTFGDFGGVYFSQFGEDIILQKLFKKKNGFYVDVGAHHPQRYSNTHLLHQRGWRGVNIDPNPETIKMFQRDRPGDINVQSGVADAAGELIYYSFSEPALNTFSREEAERWFNKDWANLLSRDSVAVLPLKDILRDNLLTGQRIDLLNIDTEGYELKVLRSNDWETWRPVVIVVEDHDFSFDNPGSDAVYSFLSGNGYKLHAVTGPSLIFTDTNIPPGSRI